MNSPGFTGPLFIIGMPRSGTKLLRGLLNQHPLIGIPPSETEFFPWLVSQRARFGDLGQRERFHRFYTEMQHIHYFQRMAELGKGITEAEWYGSCEDFTPAGLFSALLRHDTGIAPDSSGIWGDKSPSYIGHVALLKAHFPQARFIHIVRDVRDYCLSMHQAWGKNMLRAAQRWSDSVGLADSSGARLGRDFMTVRYEDLLDDPERELRRICGFLTIEFSAAMCELTGSVENLGAARDSSRIKKGNKYKYVQDMNQGTRRRIEVICAPLLQQYGYDCDYYGSVRRLGKLHMLVCQVADALNLFRFHIRERGLYRGFLLVLSLYRTSGNRLS